MDKNKQLKLVLKKCETINLKQLKIDTLLLVVHYLLTAYKKINPLETSNPKVIKANEEDLKFIDLNISNLKSYLEENIILSDTLFHIFNEQNQSEIFKKISHNLKPMKEYYKCLTTTFSSKLKEGSLFIPELLAFSLIYNYKKEHNKSFINYSLIENFPIERLIDIYNKNNLELKKNIAKEENKISWNIKTDLDEMYNVSEIMCEKYIKFNFKINQNRVSKKRTKKK